MHKVWV